MSITHRGALGLALPTLLVLAGCESKKKNNDISEPPQRAGTQLVAVAGQYSDNSPSLSEGGTKVVFLSGRDGTAEKRALHAYKADWPAGAAPGALARVTTKDVGDETEAVISPDGEWVLLQVSGGDVPGIYLQDYAGAAEPVRITEGTADALRLSFSPDSKLAAWIERSEAGSKLVLFEIGDGAAAGVADRRMDGSPAGEYVADFVFSPEAAAGSYTLVTGVKDSGVVSYVKRAFTQIADAAQVVRVDWTKGIVPTRASELAISSTKAVVATKVIPAGKKMAVRSGDFEEETKPKAAVQSEPVVIDVASGEQKTFAEPFALDVLSADAFSDDAALVTARSTYRCKEPDLNVIYGSSMVLAQADASAYVRVIPQLTADKQGFDVVDDFCKRKTADGKLTVVDDKVEAAKLAQGSTQQKYRGAYVTRFTPAFDGNCYLKVGDSEVYLLDVDGDTKKIYPLSNNKAAITSDERPSGAAACLP